MDKLWKGRFTSGQDTKADDFNSSLRFDKRMYKEDIKGSAAHAVMLTEQGIISERDGKAIIEGLEGILRDIESGALQISGAEDIHSFVENTLTARIGDAGRRLHTARSRNDQTALDLRLYLRGECGRIEQLLTGLIAVTADIAELHTDTVMCGYTHLQRAQPVTLAQHMLAYSFMLLRDLDRLRDCVKRMNRSPLGACALAGTGFDINRGRTAGILKMEGVCENSMDAVSDRDFAAELAFVNSLIMTHLSRFSEELILWSSWEFGFAELSDAFSTGSSIMPQKKNADIAELVRGKTGRVNGGLITLLTVLKGLPLAYNKDMQEDKEAIFDSVDTVISALEVFAPMLATLKINKDALRAAAARGFINATDAADYLTAKGIPFRTAYKITGEMVAYCIKNGKTLEQLSIAEFGSFSPLFDEDIYQAIDLTACVAKRTSQGGTSPQSVAEQIKIVRSMINE